MAALINYESRKLVSTIPAPSSGRNYGSRAGAVGILPLANIAHELRTPLQVVLGYLEILREECADGLGEEPRRILERMNINAHQLALTVENVMEFALGDLGGPHVDEDVSIPCLLSELKPSFDAANDGKRLALVFELADAPARIRSRRRPLRLILQNLVLNAIKFTSTGEVVVAVRRCRWIKTQAEGVEVEVGNAGCDAGIGPNAPSHSAAGRYRGMDLGLSVVRRSAEALGATIEARSASGAGPSIVVRIPTA